jgi:hypothetical protein
MRGSLPQVVGVREESSTQVRSFDDSLKTDRRKRHVASFVLLSYTLIVIFS